jgi:hypothetical protein
LAVSVAYPRVEDFFLHAFPRVEKGGGRSAPCAECALAPSLSMAGSCLFNDDISIYFLLGSGINPLVQQRQICTVDTVQNQCARKSYEHMIFKLFTNFDFKILLASQASVRFLEAPSLEVILGHFLQFFFS